MIVTGRKGTLLVAALIVSVCANVLVAGLAVGQAWWRPRPRWGAERAFERLVEPLPEPTRAAVQERFAARGDMRQRVAELRRVRTRAAEMLSKPEVSPEQLAAALAEVRRRSTEVQEATHQVIVEAVAALPPDVRRQWQPPWWTIR